MATVLELAGLPPVVMGRLGWTAWADL